MYNALESFLIDLGFSWTWAKLSPYLGTLLIGYWVFNRLERLVIKNWLKYTVMGIGFCLPFLTYFAFYPIYAADLVSESFETKTTVDHLPKQKTLAIVILPGCPYCIETIELSKKMLRNNAKIKIQYLLASEDQEGYLFFRKKLPKAIEVKIPKNPLLCMVMAQGEFPSYFLIAQQKVVKAWHNTHFGTKALDEINSFF
ncbi:MAG: hypothetical protein RLZZ65_255 [Bacteroidota bacterium]|jgi:hypothetical protein